MTENNSFKFKIPAQRCHIISQNFFKKKNKKFQKYQISFSTKCGNFTVKNKSKELKLKVKTKMSRDISIVIRRPFYVAPARKERPIE